MLLKLRIADAVANLSRAQQLVAEIGDAKARARARAPLPTRVSQEMTMRFVTRICMSNNINIIWKT